MNAASIKSYFSFSEKQGENAWLDLVRAIAISLVLLRHGFRAIGETDHSVQTFIDVFVLNGWVGVDLFFVLSGYLISKHLLRHGLGSGNFVFSRYIAMRALRIVPAYVAVIILIVAAAFPFYEIDRSALGFKVAYHLLFLQDYLPANLNVAFWSLGVEEKFYLVAPVLMWIVMTRRRRLSGVLILIGILALSPVLRAITYAAMDFPIDYDMFFRALRSPFHATLEPLVIGILIAFAQHAGRIEFSAKTGKIAFAVALAALIAFLGKNELMAEIGWFDVVAQPTIIAVLCGLLTLAAVQLKQIPLRGVGLTRTISRLSYCLYLVHLPLIPVTLVIAGDGNHSAIAFWAIYLTAGLVFAAMLHYCVEKPFLLAKDKVAKDGRWTALAPQQLVHIPAKKIGLAQN